MIATDIPYRTIPDLDGRPLDAGYVYFGSRDENPETDPVTVYWDAAGTQPAAQPIRTANGFMVRNGTPALVYVASDYSMTVRNRKRELVLYAPSSAKFAGQQVDEFTCTDGQTAFTLSSDSGTADDEFVVTLDGLVLSSSDYSVSGTAFTLATGAFEGQQLVVRYGVALPIGAVDASQVTYTPAGAGAVDTNVQAKLRERKSIKDFGAAADDTTDDTAAVLRAAQSGEYVRFEDGQMCRVTAAINAWADHTTFEGGGSEAAGGVRLDTGTATLDVLSISSGSDIHIRGLVIDAGRSVNHTAGSSVLMVGCSDSSVERCRFVLPCSNTVLVRDACDNVTVERNVFDVQGGGTAHVYFLTDVTNCKAIGNYFKASVGGCIWLSGGVLHTTIRGNRCDDSEFELIGIRYDCHFGEVSGNVATGTGDNGISVTGTGFRVFGNECYGNDFAGIGIYGSNNVVVANECRDNGIAGGSQHPGILLAANFGGLAANNTIVGNEIYRRDGATTEQYYGIRLSNTSYTGWSAGAVVTSGAYRTNANILYVSTGAGTTGATPPTHTSGTVSDGTVSWTYIGTFTNTGARPAGNRIGPNKIRNHTGGDIIRFGTSVNYFDDESQRVVTYAAPAWAQGVATEVGDVVTNTVTNVPRRYRSHTSGTTGATPPTHTSGTASDGTVTWYYIGEGALNDVQTVTEKSAKFTTPVRIECFDSTSATLAPLIYAGTVTPEGAVTAANGSIYLRSNSTYGIAVYIKTGTTNTNTGWQAVEMRLSGATGSRPGSLGAGQTGMFFFDTTLGTPIWWNGTGWVDATGAAA